MIHFKFLRRYDNGSGSEKRKSSLEIPYQEYHQTNRRLYKKLLLKVMEDRITYIKKKSSLKYVFSQVSIFHP